MSSSIRRRGSVTPDARPRLRSSPNGDRSPLARHRRLLGDGPWTRVAAPDDACPVERALAALDGRWTTLVVRELLDGPARFGELRARLPQISAKVLTERLRALERRGVVTRTARPSAPPTVEYELTPSGRRLESVLVALWRWGEEVDGSPAAGPGGRPTTRALD